MRAQQRHTTTQTQGRYTHHDIAKPGRAVNGVDFEARPWCSDTLPGFAKGAILPAGFARGPSGA